MASSSQQPEKLLQVTEELKKHWDNYINRVTSACKSYEKLARDTPALDDTTWQEHIEYSRAVVGAVFNIHKTLHVPLAADILAELEELGVEVSILTPKAVHRRLLRPLQDKVKVLRAKTTFMGNVYQELSIDSSVASKGVQKHKDKADADKRMHDQVAEHRYKDAADAKSKVSLHFWLAWGFALPSCGLSLINLKTGCETYEKLREAKTEEGKAARAFAERLQLAGDWLGSLAGPAEAMSKALQDMTAYLGIIESEIRSIDNHLKEGAKGEDNLKLRLEWLQEPAKRLQHVTRSCRMHLEQMPLDAGLMMSADQTSGYLQDWLHLQRMESMCKSGFDTLGAWLHIQDVCRINIKPKDFVVVTHNFDNSQGLDIELETEVEHLVSSSTASGSHQVVLTDQEQQANMAVGVPAALAGVDLTTSMGWRRRVATQQQQHQAQTGAEQQAVRNRIFWRIPAGQRCSYSFLLVGGKIKDFKAQQL